MIRESIIRQLNRTFIDEKTIGKKTYEHLESAMGKEYISMWDYLEYCADIKKDISLENLLGILIFNEIFVHHKSNALITKYIDYLDAIGEISIKVKNDAEEIEYTLDNIDEQI